MTSVDTVAPPPVRPRRVLRFVLGAVALGVLGVLAAFWLSGGRWLIVQTPSMGTYAPVKTVVWTRPVSGPLRVGEVIAFHPPGTHETYTHRILAVHEDGTVTTKGDINAAPDPWRTSRADVLGAVWMRTWWLGWLVEVLPILVIGGLTLAALIRWATAPVWKVPAVILGVAVLLCLSIWLTRPLVRADTITFRADGSGAEASIVATGILPLRTRAVGAEHVDLRAGQVADVVFHRPNPVGRYQVRLGPHASWWWWVALVAACFAPAVASLFRRRDPL